MGDEVGVTPDRENLRPLYPRLYIGFQRLIERVNQELNAALRNALVKLGTVNKGQTYTIRYGGKSAQLISRWLHRDLPGLARKRING